MQPSTFMQRLAVLLFSCFVLVQNASATVVAQRDGPINFVWANYGQSVSFTTSGTYENVSIYATLSSTNFQDNGAGTVYLTNSLGSGTDASNLLGSLSLTNVAYATNSSLEMLLFSGLNLLPGTYYLSAFGAANSGGLGFVGTNTPVETFDSGVSIDTDRWLNGTADPFLPASGDWADSQLDGVLFSVIGERRNEIPEPSSLLLLSLAMFSVGIMRLRKRQASSRAGSAS